MTDTVAYSGLLDLISFIGTFVNTPLWFGISFVQLLVISFCIYYVIGILLGGIEIHGGRREKPHTDSGGAKK